MTKRRALYLGLLLLLIAASVFLGPKSYWLLTGWVGNEVFYEGWPASYWRHEADRCDEMQIAANHSFWLRVPEDFTTMRELKWWLRGQNVWPLDHPLLNGDSEAVPVLLELLKDDRWNVRIIGLEGLANIGPAAKSAVPALLEARADPHSAVQECANMALSRIDPEAAPPQGR